MNDTLKAAGRIGAELGAAKAEVERLREALRKIIERCELFINDEADMRTHSIEALMGIAEDAPSQQAEPAQCINEDSWNCKYCRNTDTCEALADKRNFGEPAPAQDEQSPEQMLSREQIENIARKVHGDCIRLPGATYQHAAEAAVMYTLERIARPAQTEQQPVCDDAPPCWWIDHGSHGQITQRQDEADSAAREGKLVVQNTAAPIAQTAPQPEQSEELAWKVLQAATDALDRRAAPHAWISQAWNAGSEVITSRRAAKPTQGASEQ